MKTHKLLPLIGIALVAGTLAGCSGEVTPATDRSYNYVPESIRLKSEAIQIYVGESHKVDHIIFPVKANAAELVYTIGDTSIATVSKDGLVTPVAAGETTLTVAAKDNPSVCKTIPVYALDKYGSGKFKTELKPLAETQYNARKGFVLDTWAMDYVSLESRTKNDIEQTNEEFYLRVVYSRSKAYFEYNMYYVYTKVQDGSKEIGKRRYVIYTNDTYDTFFFAENYGGTTKNYCSIATNEYIGKNRYEALNSVISNFFSSGMKLVTQNEEDIVDTFVIKNAATSSSVSYEGGKAGDDLLALTYTQKNNDPVTAEQENNLDIPARTPLTWYLTIKNVYRDGITLMQNRYDIYDYTIDDDHFMEYNDTHARFYVNEEVDITYPSTSDYNRVDDVFDL